MDAAFTPENLEALKSYGRISYLAGQGCSQANEGHYAQRIRRVLETNGSHPAARQIITDPKGHLLALGLSNELCLQTSQQWSRRRYTALPAPMLITMVPLSGRQNITVTAH